MRNLTVFQTLKEKLGKLKLVKVAKSAILTVSLVALLAGCGTPFIKHAPYNTPQQPAYSYSESTSTPAKPTPSQPTTTEETQAPTEVAPSIAEEAPPVAIGAIESVMLDAELQAIVNSTASFSASSNTQMQSIINGITVNYQLSELFNIDTALARYNAMSSYSVQSSNFITNNRIDVAKLKTQVLANNKAFKERFAGSRFTELSSSDFDKIFGYIVASMQAELDLGGLDTNQLDAKLTGLVVMHTTDRLHGKVNIEHNMIAINLVDLAVGQQQHPDVDYLKAITMHEAKHYIQALPLDAANRLGFTENFGMAYKWDDIAINPLFTTWFYEGAAEQLMMNTYGGGIEPTNYASQVPGLDFMTMATILRSDVGPTTVPRLSLQNDLNKLFTLFNCTTPAQQKEVLNMMFAYEFAATGHSEFERLPEILAMPGSQRTQYKYGLRASMAQTQAKSFYSNLSSQISSQQIKMEEIFTVISIYETNLARLTRYTSGERATANRDFLENYTNLQTEFFAFLAKDSGVDLNQLIRAYNAYHTASSANTVRLTFLDNSDSEYFRNMAVQMQGDKTSTVRATYDALVQKNNVK